MALEPISSAMTYQAQPVAQSMSAPAPLEKRAEEFTEGSSESALSQPVDNVTLSVKASGETDTEGNKSDNGSQNQQTGLASETKRIKEAIEEMNKKVANSEAQFGIHEDTNRVTIKIVDKRTKEVIKELPPEKTLDMIARIWDMAGLLVDEKR